MNIYMNILLLYIYDIFMLVADRLIGLSSGEKKKRLLLTPDTKKKNDCYSHPTPKKKTHLLGWAGQPNAKTP